MRKIKRWISVIFIITVVVLFIIIDALPNLSGAMQKTHIIEYGGIQETDQVTAYIIRDESVYLANKTGILNYYAEEGEQVRKGVKILDIHAGDATSEGGTYAKIMDRIQRFNGGESIFSDDIKRINAHIKALEQQRDDALSENEIAKVEKLEKEINRLTIKKEYIQATDNETRNELIRENAIIGGYGMKPEQYISQRNGIVSYYVDGYESEFTPENMTLLTKEKLQNLSIETYNLARESTLANEPLFKLINHNEWYAVFWVAPENIIKYEKGKTAYLNLPLGQVEGNIYDIIDANGEWLVILKFNRYYEDFAKIRKVEAEVVTSDNKGLTIKNESITTVDGEPGVYVKGKSGEFVFTPVKIITSDGEWSLVEVSYFYKDNGETRVSTVNIYDEILKNPQ
ncbi:MAG: HlyD family efflux transporter periplasmic adaptor subunit [Anaerovoracaceae bacterium]